MVGKTEDIQWADRRPENLYYIIDQVRRSFAKKLSENAEAWCVIPEDNERCLFVLNSELGRRS